ncbi:MAG: hypothetical protein ABSG57_01315 [Candidatus Bathyarchaeia archaeon]
MKTNVEIGVLSYLNTYGNTRESDLIDCRYRLGESSEKENPAKEVNHEKRKDPKKTKPVV